MPYTLPTTPIPGMKMGTSGLRKKTAVFRQPLYLENLLECILLALGGQQQDSDPSEWSLVLGGDGRAHTREAIAAALAAAHGHGVGRVVVGAGGLLSTPGASAAVRARGCVAAVLFTASHNPGGDREDFGVKVNLANGAPADDGFAAEVFRLSKEVRSLSVADPEEARALAAVDLSRPGEHSPLPGLVVEVIDPVADHLAVLEASFDFAKLRLLLARKDFKFYFDAMNAVTGPYARRVFVDALGAPAGCVLNGAPKPDFGGVAPDPCPAHATALMAAARDPKAGLVLGVASDGDGDRNMVVGPGGEMVGPSDSLAVLAAQSHLIRQFEADGGLRGVARSMPTSQAVDRVARELGVPHFETPTGWKYFGNLLDTAQISLCGEESFGTGAAHIREKDGIWAALAWLSILAHRNQPLPQGSRDLVTPLTLLGEHWARFGRNYFQRHDFEDVDPVDADRLMRRLGDIAAEAEQGHGLVGHIFGEPAGPGSFALELFDSFTYHDPVDGAVARNQGYRAVFADDSRIIIRVSGTSSAGATLRLYLERYMPRGSSTNLDPAAVLQPLYDIAAELMGGIKEATGKALPTMTI